MLINNINIKTFKAKLLDRTIRSADLNIENEWLNLSLTPIITNKLNYKYKMLTVTLDIICSDANELEVMKGNIINQLSSAIIKFDDIDYYYRGCINGLPTSSYIMKGNETLAIQMLVISEKIEIAENINRVTTKTINVPGNQATPCIIEITPSIDIIDITLEGLADDPIIIKNLKANKKVIVDGEGQTVTVDGVNKYGDTDMWDFPRLVPGANTLKFNKNICDIKVRYKPRFI